MNQQITTPKATNDSKLATSAGELSRQEEVGKLFSTVPSRRKVHKWGGRWMAFAFLACALVHCPLLGAPGDLTLVSITADGTKNSADCRALDISADGTKVLFSAEAGDLGFSTTYQAIYVKDLVTGKIQLVSQTREGISANGYCAWAEISADGRRVAFESTADNLHPDDSDHTTDVYVKDLETGRLWLASVRQDGEKGDWISSEPSISSDGNRVAFTSGSTNLDPAVNGYYYNVYVKDLETGKLILASISSMGFTDTDRRAATPVLSGDGMRVAFEAGRRDLIPGVRTISHIFVKDLESGEILLASANSSGEPANQYSLAPGINSDGTRVTFYTDADNLDSADNDTSNDVFLKDMETGESILVSRHEEEFETFGESPVISGDGWKVAFHSNAISIHPTLETCTFRDECNWLFVMDVETGTVRVASENGLGVNDRIKTRDALTTYQLSADGRFVVFSSRGDRWGEPFDDPILDVYVKELGFPSDSPGGGPQPPAITQPPQSVVWEPGETGRLEVQAESEEPLFYQWRKNGVNLPGETAAALTIEAVDFSHGGLFEVIASNETGAVLSVAAEATVNVAPLPFNDTFAQRGSIRSESGFGQGMNTGTTSEPMEPAHGKQAGGKSIWIDYTAPATGILTLSTVGSAFDTILAVYSGETLDNLVPIVRDDDSGGFLAGEVRFNVKAGESYAIAVDGFGTADAGIAILSWELEPTEDLVPVIIEQPISQTIPPGGAVELSVEVQQADVAYQWLVNGNILDGATEAVLALADPAPGNYVARITTASGRTIESQPARIERGPLAGGVTTEGKLALLFDEAMPAGQAIAASRRPRASQNGFTSVAAGSIGAQIFDNLGSTTEPGEPLHAQVSGGASRWFGIEANEHGYMELDTQGSEIDTVIAVYTGSSLQDLQLIVENNNPSPGDSAASVRFAAAKGVRYAVAVDGVQGASGKIQLRWHHSRDDFHIHGPHWTDTGKFSIQILGIPGQSVAIEQSPDLKTWSPAGSVLLPNGLADYRTPVDPSMPQFFLRVKSE